LATSAQSIIKRVVGTLQDPTHERWKVDELVRFLNDGQLEIVAARPDTTATTAVISLGVGARQSIPTTAVKLLAVQHNASGRRRAVSLVDKQLLDAQVPGWQSMTASTEVVHYTHDLREPRTFYVYPPAANGAAVEASYTAMPTAVAEPTQGEAASITNVSGDIGVPDIFANALTDYVLYRAYMKDAETNNPQLAQVHYQQFTALLGAEINAAMVVAPKD
jgi:hypothetical protein